MDDSELDEFFIKTLYAILEDMKDCAEYIKNQNSPEFKEIKDDYKKSIKSLSKLLKKIHSIDDLAETSDDTITEVFEYIEDYTANFVIAAENPQKQKDLEEYDKLEALLFLFVDDDNPED